MDYYLAGYYLIGHRALNEGPFKDKEVFTCSNCINFNLLANFFRYNQFSETEITWAKTSLQIEKRTLTKIRNWTKKKFEEEKIDFDLFYDLETAIEYRDTFFKNRKKVTLHGLYLPGDEAAVLLEDFKPQNDKEREIGIRKTLASKTKEGEEGEDIGFDLIGIEYDGSFHSFHCHDLMKELKQKFNTRLNDFGLIKSDANYEKLVQFMNNEDTPCEPLPWYFTKIKLIR